MTSSIKTRRFKKCLIPFLFFLFLFSAISAQLNEEQKLIGQLGGIFSHNAGDQKGYSLSIDGDYAIVGLPWSDEMGTDAGMAVIYHWNGIEWSEESVLLASDGAALDRFGLSVAISGNKVIIGSRLDDDNGSSSGSAYIFEQIGNSWVEQAKLLPSDGTINDFFGWSVAISGNTAIVSSPFDDDNGTASGSAYIFAGSGNNWTEQAKLLPSDGSGGDEFGFSVAISGSTVIVGAHLDNVVGTDSGSSYIFTGSGNSWSEQVKLIPSDSGTLDAFGHSVSISGNTVIIGSHLDDDNGTDSGAAYIFDLIGNSWVEQNKLLASDGSAGDEFGFSVSISSSLVVIGARRDDDNGIDSGSAYTFEKIGSCWIQKSKLVPSDGIAGDEFGFSVAISDNTSVVGSHFDDDNGNDSGSSYIFLNEQASLEPSVVDESCAGLSDGSITINVVGLTGAHTYSLDGDVAQLQNVFSGLSSGVYSIEVFINADINCVLTEIVTVGTGVDMNPPTISCPSNMALINDPGECGAIAVFDVIVTDDCSSTSEVTETFTFSGAIENWIVPPNVTEITIEASGAQGGFNGGFGAIMSGDFTVSPGDVIEILAGGAGATVESTDYSGGGGGGGSFVINAGSPLIVAGGGGGNTSYLGCTPYDPAISNAQLTTYGASTSGAGGSGGNGGGSGVGSVPASGGGGFLTNGIMGHSSGGFPGLGFSQGGAGGAGLSIIPSLWPGVGSGDGGFGGGAGATWNNLVRSGGGGGYSGGQGGGFCNYHSGAGGGSINNGSNQNNSIGNLGDGIVTISYTGLTVICDPPSGSFFPVGHTAVNCDATDAFGNTASCSFIVTVTDNENPSISCPEDIEVNSAIGDCSSIVTFDMPTGSDNCVGETISQISGISSGSSFPIGTTINTFLITDAYDNTASCSFAVTVADNFAPTISCPSDITVLNDPGNCSAIVNYTVTSSDNCPGETINQTAGLASGSAFPVGTTTNTFVVMDSFGNSTSCSFNVTVTDTEDPLIFCPSNILVSNDPGECSSVVNYSVSSNDNCSGETLSLVSGPDSGSAFPVGHTAVNWMATDASGNVSTCSFIVSVTDEEDPILSCPNDITASNDPGTCGAMVTYSTPIIIDNCTGGTVNQTSGLPSGSIFPAGTTLNTFLATDAYGNTAECSFNVTVNNDGVETAVCQDIVVQLDLTGNASITVEDIDGGSDVNAILTASQTTFTCADLGQNSVTLSASTLVGSEFTDTGQALGFLESQNVALADLDGDGDQDAFVVNHTIHENNVYLNDGAGNFTNNFSTIWPGSSSDDVSLADLDGDGDIDAFVANNGAGQANIVWMNNGDGSFTDSGQLLGTSRSYGISLADLDGDGDQDAFVANTSSQPNKVWINDGSGNFIDSNQSLGNSSSFDVFLADLDGDGDKDAFVANIDNQSNRVWFNDGNGLFSVSSQILGSSSSNAVALADLDGDGDQDVFVANNDGYNTPQFNTVWLNQGDGTFVDSGQLIGNSASHDVALEDLDGDGDIDAFVANYTTDAGGSFFPDKIWLNDGLGNFTDSGQLIGEQLPSNAIALADLDCDGDQDAFFALGVGFAIPNTVWLNTPTLPMGVSGSCTATVSVEDPLIVCCDAPALTIVVENETCPDENDGIITVNTTGGSGIFTYSLNGGTEQTSNVFTDLPPDTYTIEVFVDGNMACSVFEMTTVEEADPQWTEKQKLVGQVNSIFDHNAGDQMGYSVAIDGNLAVVGFPWTDIQGTDAGMAVIYGYNGMEWEEESVLLANDGAELDRFGLSVAISGNTAIVGARLDDDNGMSSGSAYIYQKIGSSWVQSAKLLPSDGEANEFFGWSVAISNNTAIVGAPFDDENGSTSGSAYIFTGSGITWNEQTKLLPSDGAGGDEFGFSVAISGNNAIVGSKFDDDNGSNSGSAYIFNGSGNNWNQETKLLPADGAVSDSFGHSVAISGNCAIIGAHLDDDNGGSSGSAYIFEFLGNSWTEQVKLLPSDGTGGDEFGFSVSISATTAMVGSKLDDDNGIDSGSAYIFESDQNSWIEQTKLISSDGMANDQFGHSVGVSCSRAIVGANFDDENDADSGSAFVFSFPCPCDGGDMEECDGIDNDGDGLIDENCAQCIAENFVNMPTGLIAEQTGTTTRLKWDHYSDASDACILRGALSDGVTNTGPFGQILIQGAFVNGDIDGFDKSAQLAPNANYTLFNPSTFPAGPTNSLIPGAQYIWQVRCGCLIDPSLPLPDRLATPNVHLSPWSPLNVFTNLALPGIIEDNSDPSELKMMKDGFILYPNPNNGDFTLDFSEISNKVFMITIMNALGELVYTKSNFGKNENVLQMSIASEDAGIYIVNVITDNGTYNSKLIKN